MGFFWENYYDTQPERTDVYIFESLDGKYSYQLSKQEIKDKFKPSEFSEMLDGNHPFWFAYKR